MAAPSVVKQEWKDELEAISTSRGWILNSYAQVEFLLGHLMVASQRLPEYRRAGWSLPRNLELRAGGVRELLKSGPFSTYESSIAPLLDEICSDDLAATRHLLVHGFCTFHATPAGEMAVQFRRFVPGAKKMPATLEQRFYRRADLEAERSRLTALTNRILQAIGGLCIDLGFGDSIDPSDLMP